MSPRPPRARHAHRAHRYAASYMLNCKQQQPMRAVAEWQRELSSNIMQADTLFNTFIACY